MTKQELIKAAKLAYYNTDTPIMTDEQYDRLVKETGEEEVGAPVLEELKKIKITDKPMLSLAKCHTSVELNNFAQGQDLIASIKCDGLSVRLIYENGMLIQGNTRGDGETGQDITEHLKYFVNVPYIINDKHRVVIDGEAIIFQKDFNKININGEFKNPRNLAAGTLASLDPTLCQSRHLSFLAWDLIEGSDLDFYHERMNYICHNLDIDIVPWFCFGGEYTYDSLNQEILDIAKEKGIPCDGVVWKYDNINYNTKRTAHHFCNAIAWKPAMTEYETSLIDIEWTMGRTGILTPVAIYKDVDTGDSIINRASLHNISILNEILGMPFEGQKIKVCKQNEIIPTVVNAQNEKGEWIH